MKTTEVNNKHFDIKQVGSVLRSRTSPWRTHSSSLVSGKSFSTSCRSVSDNSRSMKNTRIAYRPLLKFIISTTIAKHRNLSKNKVNYVPPARNLRGIQWYLSGAFNFTARKTSDKVYSRQRSDGRRKQD
jgi:hypothetical protein